MPTDFVALQEPFEADAIRTVNFFNGRLLTGADMGREQAARREAGARIGMAVGDGVAAGLEVTYLGNVAPNNQPAAQVTGGVAISRTGQTLCLKQPVSLALARAAPPGAASVACLFNDCAPLAAGDYVGGAGLYLLTIGPAFTTEGRAQVSGMGDASARCATDATVEAVQFRLLEVRPELFGSTTFGAPDFRNRIAYHAFGAGVGAAWPADVLGSVSRQDDLIEAMRDHGLSDEEVPLALMAFEGSFAHVFTDGWSVRRPVFPRDPDTVFANLAEPRRIGLGRAMFRQFQDEVDDIARVTGALAATVARTRFAQLPPAGLLPILTDAQIAAFFAGMTVAGPLYIDASCVEPLIRESFTAPAIDTASDHAVWVYRIAETRMAGKADVAVFASGHLPYRGDARFNLNHWDFANYALIP